MVPEKASRPDLTPADSGVTTPRANDQSYTNLAEVTNEEKARVLRRHLVSADIRRPSSSTPGPPESTSPGDTSPSRGDGMDGLDRRRSSAMSSNQGRKDADEFPIPYDAPGGDVT